jgi:glycosyltransferase involved in cell wall biosynthesis
MSSRGLHQRIGLYAPVLDQRPTGLGRFIRETAEPLLEHEPTVYAQLAEADWLHGAKLREPSIAGIRLRHPAGRRAIRLGWLAGPVRRDVRRDGIRVLYCPGQEGPLIRSSASVCLVVHDLIGLRVPTGRHPLDLAQLRLLLPRMITVADRVATVSASTRKDVLELSGAPEDKVVVVPPAVDHGTFWRRDDHVVRVITERLGLPERYLLYAGTLSAHKNLDVVLQALDRSRTAGTPPATLVVAGRSTSSDLHRFRAAVARHGLEDHVALVGYTSDDDLAALMSGALAFVFPSLYEGFGLAPLEAMACGAPVLSSAAASLPEVVGDAGLLLDPVDTEAWASALAHVPDDTAHREELRERSLDRARRFRWSTTNGAIRMLLEGLAD